jgi:hypothetical protein
MALSAVVTAGLAIAGVATLTTPSHADPGSCDTAFPVANLVKGQDVTGLTVTSGTTPDQFTGKIIGVLQDGIEPGVDMVMAQLSSPEISDDGIWEGMSGSPVYDKTTGELIGAVAYTLSYGETSVAGITPWADMQTYAGQPAPTNVKVTGAAARKIADATSVTAGQAAQGFHEVATPHVVTGLSQRVLDRAAKDKHVSRFLSGSTASAAGRASSDDVTPADMTAGGNLVATLSTGDVTQGGVGTITSVCGDRVVGFGHPMNFTGKATMGMAGADTLYVQGDPLNASFKVTNIGGLLGSIDQDRATGISGPLGTMPASTPITSTVTYTPDGGAATSRTGTSQVQMPQATAQTAYYELMANHLDVIDGYQGGTEQQTFTVTGHSSAGAFHLTGGNVYTDSADIEDPASYDVADLSYLLTNIPGVTVDGITVHSKVTDSTKTLTITGIQQHRGGAWVTLGKGHPAVVKGGSTLQVRLTFAGGTKGKVTSIKVPKVGKKQFHPGMLFAESTFGFPFERGNPQHLDGVKKLVHNAQRNDQAQISMIAFDKRRIEQVRSLTPPQGLVINGHFRASVVVH